ncbi:YbdD/YjiX family protein [Isoptericola sp. NPDC056134]|uniref:YbdD/YjiX family protein n=1 Tax=unclassified Isoptericola TaxID=2623355 RepID=UPI0035E6EBDF
MPGTTDARTLGATARDAARALARAASAGWTNLRWYVRQVMGDDAYRTYVTHERSAHPDREPMGEREFWREHYAEQDRNPGSRCC